MSKKILKKQTKITKDMTILELMYKRVFTVHPFTEETNPKWLYVDDDFCYTTKPRSFEFFMFIIKNNVNNLNLENEQYFRKCYDDYVEILKDYKYLQTTNSKWYKPVKLLHSNSLNASPRSKEYWVCRGYSEEVAVLKVKELLNQTSKTSFIIRYGEDEGTRLYNEYTTKKSKQMKDYYKTHDFNVPYSKTINPDTGLVYTFEESMLKNKDNFKIAKSIHTKNIKDGKSFTIWQPQYWINLGFSEEETKEIIYSKMAHNSIKYFVEKYGVEVGTKKYEDRMKKFKDTWNSKSPEELELIYLKRTKVPHKVSKSSIKFFEKCMNILKNDYHIELNRIYYNDSEFHLYDRDNKTIYFYDYCDLDRRIIVEYNGCMFHPYKDVNGDDLKNWKSLFYKISGVNQRLRDINKLKKAEDNNFTYLVVWDIEDPQLSIDNFIKLYINTENELK